MLFTKNYKKKNLITYLIFLIIIGFLFWRGFNTSAIYLPKPKGYIRIELPKHEYVKLANNYPYSFEYSKHAIIKNVKPDHPNEAFWIDITYPGMNATIHITHQFIDSTQTLKKYWKQVHIILSKHQIMASEMVEKAIVNEHNVKIILIEFFGEHIASQYQFYTTDYKKHFLMACLYFNTLPNQEYLQPMIDYIKEDMKHMINTFKWGKS